MVNYVPQKIISLECPVIINHDSFPVTILFVLYSLCLLLSVKEAVLVFHKQSSKSNIIEKLFLVLISLFLFFRSFLLTIPLPYESFSFYFLCDEFPRYLMFLAWEFLALWLGSAVVSTLSHSKSSCNLLTILFILTFVALFAITIALCILITIRGSSDKWDHNRLLLIVDSINYFIITVSIMIYGIRLFQIFLKFKISDDFRIRIRILLILIFCMFGIFCIRFCWTLTTLTNCNVFAPLINQLVDSVKEGQQRWAYYYTYYCLFFCVFEIVPSLLLLSVFFVLSLHSPKSKSDSRAASKVYYISKAKHGADIDGIAVLPVLPTEAVFQKQKGTRMGGSDRGKTRDREREKERERSGKRRSRDSRTRTYEGDMKDGTQVIITSNEEGGVRSQSRRYKQGSAKSGHKRREESESERGREDRRREREKSGAGQQAERGIHHSKNDMRSGERRAVHSPSPVSNQSSKAREAFGASYGKHHVHVHTHGHRHKGRKERGEWEKRERERERERERQRVEGSENEETVAMLRHEEQQQQQQQQQNIGASGVGVFGEGADGTGGGGGGGGGGNEDITLPSSLASSVGVLKEQGYMPISGAFFAAGNVLKEKEKERDKEREKEKEKEISEEDNYSINADGFGGYPYASSASPSCASPSRSSSSHPIPFSAFPFTSNAAISASSAANATAINSSSSFSSSSSSSSSTAAASLLASSFLSTSSSSSSSSSSVQLPPYSLHPNDDPTFILSEIQSFAPS